METKKREASSAGSFFSTKQAVDFVGDVKGEIGKITWTSKEELIAYTKIVVGATFFCGLAIYAMDLVIKGALTGLGVFMRLITR